MMIIIIIKIIIIAQRITGIKDAGNRRSDGVRKVRPETELANGLIRD